jgi:nitrite reductase/ring-hydroxylating ferredoxin subunit
MDTTPTPDFTTGVPAAVIPDGGILLGHVGEEDVVLVRRGGELFAVGAYCTHNHGPLAQGVAVGDTLRCPLHHACFSLRTGEALRAPALDPIDCWRVEHSGDTVVVREKITPAPVEEAAANAAPSAARGSASAVRAVVIGGGGAAGLAAAASLRRHGYGGALTMISADDSPPCDRPNLSKDYLLGTAPETWIALRTPQFCAQAPRTRRVRGRRHCEVA